MLRNVTCLIIDSDTNSCEEIEEFLAGEGHTVLCAHSASEGEKQLQRSRFDILVLDLGLPDQDGLQFYRETKSKFPDLEVILISGQGSMDCVIQAMHLGAIDFLRKPLRQNDLQSAIGRSKKLMTMNMPPEQQQEPVNQINLVSSANHRKKIMTRNSEIKFKPSNSNT